MSRADRAVLYAVACSFGLWLSIGLACVFAHFQWGAAFFFATVHAFVFFLVIGPLGLIEHAIGLKREERQIRLKRGEIEEDE